MTSWMKLEGTILTDIRQTEKDKEDMASLIYRTKKAKHGNSRKVAAGGGGGRNRKWLVKGTNFGYKVNEV